MRRTAGVVVLGLVLLLAAPRLAADGQGATQQLLRHSRFVVNEYTDGDFPLAYQGRAADLYVDPDDQSGVAWALADLKSDIAMVTGLEPVIKTSPDQLGPAAVLVGTIGHSAVIDSLIAGGKLDVEGIAGKWEAYVIQVVENPVPDVAQGMVIAGSDRRGTIYGIYEVSRQIGVSPWYWWADVAPEQQDHLLVRPGIYKQGEPSVKYRGIFLNNEAPSLSTWVQRFGGFNHQFYEKVFELVLRLRGNFLWPAMWSPKSFFRDDPLSPRLAHEYGVVIGTSHHEPMMRAWGEWGRFGKGVWNFSTNRENLLQFWEEGIKWAKDYEKIVTIGMRGDGDEPMMHDGTLDEMVATMEQIISDQRQILAGIIDPDLGAIPQVWALYKEVQHLYEAGLKVPDDVTILLANDNFGNLRMLPQGEERNHPGGFGMYYHFDYVGGPKSYRWVNSTPNHKIWEQMSMAYDYGVDQIWIVNVGDLKPHEIAIEFFLELAYDVDKWHKDNLDQFSLEWAEREFGPEYAAEIARITDTYRKFTGRKKSEDMQPETYSLLNYKEAERVLAEYEEISILAEQIYEKLPEHKKDAFYQLVLYPTRASKNVVKVNIYAGLNNLYAAQGRVSANLYADLAEQAFAEEAADTDYYNTALAGGKWRGIMSNAHIGQQGWETPPANVMPPVKRIFLESGSEMGIAVEGVRSAYTAPNAVITTLPGFNVFTQEPHYLEIFNLKADPFEVEVIPSDPWITVAHESKMIDPQSRIWIDIDWDQAPRGEDIRGAVTITGAGKTITVAVRVYNPEPETFAHLPLGTFIESDGFISIEAEHYAVNTPFEGYQWHTIDNYGRTLSSMKVFPTLGPVWIPPDAPCLEYQVYVTTPGYVTVTVYTAPTNNLNRQRGLCYGIAFDDQRIQIIDTFPKENDAFYTSPLWSRGVMDNVRATVSRHRLDAGLHTLKIWLVDPGVVLQKIVVDAGGVKPSYLGPPESFYIGAAALGQDKDGYLELLRAYDYGRFLLATTLVGANHGQTSRENFDQLREELNQIQLVLKDTQAALSQRLAALESLRSAIDHFRAAIVFKEGYVELENLLAETRSFLAAAKIGSSHEQYPAAARLELLDVVRAADAVLRSEAAAAEERAAVFNRLAEALEKFKGSKIIDPNHRILKPAADAFVRGGAYGETIFGSRGNLEVKWERDNEGMTRVAFIKFDVSSLATVERAVLKLYVEWVDELESRVISLYDVTGMEWSEPDLTWENASVTGGKFITARSVSNEADVWYEFNITQMVKAHVEQGSAEITIRIENSTSHWAGLVRFTSREGIANTPELSVIGLQKQ